MSTFMLGRRDFLKAAAAGGFVLTPAAQAVSAAIAPFPSFPVIR